MAICNIKTIHFWIKLKLQLNSGSSRGALWGDKLGALWGIPTKTAFGNLQKK